ncbi:MAG: ATP-binding protein [Methanoregula sp.]|jgi:hypothetical protein|uniref:AlbA family DNA-binding domain-containing protein n=1 Tax=Methanoregula sp. TaxID=2052170 RepID=UPI003C2938D2
MGFIEDYFRKSELSEADVQDFIAQKNKESLTLDYKRIEKFKDNDLSEHVSAFANSAGGLIILGVEERDELPVRITWGNSTEYQKESLESRLFSTIYPKIDGLKIIPIAQTSDPSKRIFLIDIPQGDNPPYMAHDNRYYKRLNFQKQPMEGYEVADCFGRRRRPKLSMNLTDNHFHVNNAEQNYLEIQWDIYVKNVGKSIAREILCKIESIPATIVRCTDEFQTIRDDNSKIYVKGIFTDRQKYLIFPHPTMETYLGTVHFKSHINMLESKCKISYELLAENMPIIRGEFDISISVLGGRPIFREITGKEEELKDW